MGKIKAIVCIDQDWGIGKNNDLLFKIPDDLKFFKRKTMGHVVMMGRKTLESLPDGKPLEGRLNIVLTSKENIENCMCVHSFEDLLQIAKSIQEDVYIIGGASLYNQMYPYFDELLVTRVSTHKDADAWFPHEKIRQLFTVTHRGEIKNFEGYKYRFLVYERKAI